MILLAIVILGWCLLSLPIGILVGRLMRTPAPAAGSRMRLQYDRPRSSVLA